MKLYSYKVIKLKSYKVTKFYFYSFIVILWDIA